MYHFGTSDDLVGQILGWSGTAAAWFLYLSPVATMQRILRERSTLQFEDTPCVISLFNCLLWVAYSILKTGRLQPLVTNVVGVAAQLSFLCIMLLFHAQRKRAILLVKVLLTAAAFGGTLLVTHVVTSGNQQKQSDMVGIVADVVNCLMYAAPLSVIGTVVRTKSVEFMPLGLSLGTLLCSCTWLTYGVWVGDLYIGLPNSAGVVLGVVQVTLYAFYARYSRRSPNLLGENGKELGNGDGSPAVPASTGGRRGELLPVV